MSEQPPPSYSQASNPSVGQPPVQRPASQPPVQLPAGQPPVQLTAGVAQPQVFWKVGPDGQPQVFYSTGMQPLLQPTFQAVPYMPVQPAVQPVTSALPPSLQPYSFLALSLTIMIVCAILNITSLVFGIPALVLSMRSEERKQNYQYESAKKSGAIALGLSVLNIIYNFITITLAIGLSLGLILQNTNDRTCYYDYYYYCY